MSATETNSTEYAIWSRLLQPGKPTFSPDVARAVLALDFPPEEKARLRELAAKAREGTLTPEEQEQIDSYGRVGSVLSILKSKARVSLRSGMADDGRIS